LCYLTKTCLVRNSQSFEPGIFHASMRLGTVKFHIVRFPRVRLSPSSNVNQIPRDYHSDLTDPSLSPDKAQTQ
jgi:hypothetical protein